MSSEISETVLMILGNRMSGQHGVLEALSIEPVRRHTVNDLSWKLGRRIEAVASALVELEAHDLVDQYKMSNGAVYWGITPTGRQALSIA